MTPQNAIHDDESIMKIISSCEVLIEYADQSPRCDPVVYDQLFSIFFDLLSELGWLKQSHMVLLNQLDEAKLL